MVKVIILSKNHHQLSFVVAIRSNHSVLMPRSKGYPYKLEKVQTSFSNGDTEIRYLREIILARDEPLDIGK